MTEQMVEPEPETRREVGSRVAQQLPLMIVLVVLWILLWGVFSWLNVVTGIILAVIVTRVFYLPAVALTGRLNPWYLAVFLAHFLVDLVRASFQVAALAFRGVSRNSVIAVQLKSRSDLMTTLTAIAISLIPGSIVVEVDRDRSTLYLHVLNTPDRERAASARTAVLDAEARIVRALGSAADLRRVNG